LGEPSRGLHLSAKPVLLAVVSDVHCGSTIAACPPEGVRLDDAGTYHPSVAQSWLWEQWEDFWKSVQVRVKQEKAKLICCYNGDLFEGNHHGSTQVISNNPEPAAYLADRVFGVPRALKPDQTFVIRGTEAHVGPSGATEEAFARSIRAVKNEHGKTWSWWHLQLEIHGRLFDFQHHGRMGQRPWTRANIVAMLAAQIFYERAARKLRHPDIAFRSHHHQYQDSHNAHPVRVIQTPAWQLKTAYAHKVAADSLADVGGIQVLVTPDGEMGVTAKLYQPELGPIWRIE